YVTRKRDLVDRRKYLIDITEEGDKIATDFMDKLSDGLGEKLSKLTEEDRKKYLEALNTLQYILNKEEFR
ncbi:MarR family transcriptional regulator, partial [Clostridioides difficile]|nr:MarR family transcriptional regulator [Clostridioides difficile]